jgi:hypothetical protein
MSPVDHSLTETAAYASVQNAALLMEQFETQDVADPEVLEDDLCAAISMSALIANGCQVQFAAKLAYRDSGFGTADALMRLRDAANRLLAYMNHCSE